MGPLLREWRRSRRMSQLDLALQMDVSARHLSRVECGRAQPSRDLVSRLADALGMPLRERNGLLAAAGYAREYPETSLDTPAMAEVRRAIEFIIGHQEPYPAFVLNRRWDVLMASRGAAPGPVRDARDLAATLAAPILDHLPFSHFPRHRSRPWI